MEDRYPFDLMPLPYDYNALEPYINAETMEIHRDKYLKAYVGNRNKALKDYPQYQRWSLKELLAQLDLLPCKIRTEVRNSGGGYIHSFYFNIMGNRNNKPAGKIKSLIESSLRTRLLPILPMDVWEQAYYLKYQNRRADYVDNWFHVINRKAVEGNMTAGLMV